MLSLYDTVSRKKVPLDPLRPGRVGVYPCGPTVYRYGHIGNLRTYLLTDLLLRAVRFAGLTPFSVQNITDMGHVHQDRLEQGEGKMIAFAKKLEEKGVTYGEGGYLYFDVTKAQGYGQLAGAVVGGGEAARRTDSAIHRKKRRPEAFSGGRVAT